MRGQLQVPGRAGMAVIESMISGPRLRSLFSGPRLRSPAGGCLVAGAGTRAAGVCTGSGGQGAPGHRQQGARDTETEKAGVPTSVWLLVLRWGVTYVKPDYAKLIFTPCLTFDRIGVPCRHGIS